MDFKPEKNLKGVKSYPLLVGVLGIFTKNQRSFPQNLWTGFQAFVNPKKPKVSNCKDIAKNVILPLLSCQIPDNLHHVFLTFRRNSARNGLRSAESCSKLVHCESPLYARARVRFARVAARLVRYGTGNTWRRRVATEPEAGRVSWGTAIAERQCARSRKRRVRARQHYQARIGGRSRGPAVESPELRGLLRRRGLDKRDG